MILLYYPGQTYAAEVLRLHSPHAFAVLCAAEVPLQWARVRPLPRAPGPCPLTRSGLTENWVETPGQDYVWSLPGHGTTELMDEDVRRWAVAAEEPEPRKELFY